MWEEGGRRVGGGWVGGRVEGRVGGRVGWRMGEKKGRIAGLREDQKNVGRKGEMEVRERYGERKI